MTWGWVVDASVAVKLYLPEEHSSIAEALFEGLADDEISIFVPDHFYSECANVLWKHVRRAEISPDHARQSLHKLTALNLFPVSSPNLLVSALDLALSFGTTAYDALYVVLAQSLALPFVSADERLIRKLAGTGSDVRWLGDLPS